MSYINIDSSANQELAKNLLTTNFAGTALEGHPETDTEWMSGILIAKNLESFKARDLPAPDGAESNGSSDVKVYTIEGCTVFVESGENDGLHIYPAGTTVVDFLRDWDTGNMEWPEFIAGWGFDGTPDKADADATDVRIWCEPNYFAGTCNAPVGHYVDLAEVSASGPYGTLAESCEHARFATVADAQAWIDEQESGVYCTSHGEVGRPAYTICE